MTSVASYGAGTTAGNYTLVFSGTTLGKWVVSFASEVSRVTPVNVRTSHWSTTTKLDGSYPAKQWKHDITLYTEPTSLTREKFADQYFAFSDWLLGAERPLHIVSGYTAPTTIYFGLCLLAEPPKMSKPDELLLYEAGFIQLSFLGTTKPVVSY